jgi:hypothetical protein
MRFLPESGAGLGDRTVYSTHLSHERFSAIGARHHTKRHFTRALSVHCFACINLPNSGLPPSLKLMHWFTSNASQIIVLRAFTSGACLAAIRQASLRFADKRSKQWRAACGVNEIPLVMVAMAGFIYFITLMGALRPLPTEIILRKHHACDYQACLSAIARIFL